MTKTAEYWQNLTFSPKEIEFIQTHLFETEVPLTTKELLNVFLKEHIRVQKEAELQKRKMGGKIYIPRESYGAGDDLVFPVLNWAKGKVLAVRRGVNPDVESFDVLDVVMHDGEARMFAASLENHALNQSPPDQNEQDDTSEIILSQYGKSLEKKLEQSLKDDDNLVRIAGRWFPSALLIDVNVGHLNLAEAVLFMADGEPLPTSALLKDVELPEGVNVRLAEFSLNYALQEDPRFDEVGPAGQVLWCLKNLEPEEVQRIPKYLLYTGDKYDRSALSADMLSLEAELDDELSGLPDPEEELDEITLILTYPHWRTGTLPITSRARVFFPTAYESPRIRFTLVDEKTSEKFAGWVVREQHYVSGLREWYETNELIPGSLVTIKHGKNPGEVLIKAHTHRQNRDWVRTVIVGADGGLVFALLKQIVSTRFNDRMVLAVPDVAGVDAAWEKTSQKKHSFRYMVVSIMQELTKLNPQGHVHAQELYSALNILHRCPPGPLFSLLASDPAFTLVGDLHFRLDDEALKEARS